MDAYTILKNHHHSSHGKNDSSPLPHIPEIPHQNGISAVSDRGRAILWVTFGIMAGSTIIFALLTLRQNVKLRLFHHITLFITLFASIAYFAMAVGTGTELVRAPGEHAFREVFYARYVDWAVTTPLLLLDLALLSGLPAADTVLLIIADVGMIITGLFAALDPQLNTRWGFYAFSCLFFIYVLYTLLMPARKTAYLRSDRVGQLFVAISVYTVLLWTAYPIIWALAEGTNFVSSDVEVLVYAILDILAKPVFGLWLLIAHGAIAESNVILPAYWVEPRGAPTGYGAIGSSVPSAHDS